MSIPAPLQQVDRTYVRVGKRKLSYFAGCDYFRLASHPKVVHAAEQTLHKCGLNVAASRMTTGNHSIYERLEGTLADFFECESASVVANGYSTNLIVAQALAERFCHVLIDEKAHPSLHDAAPMFGGHVASFRHRDPSDLWKIVQQCDPRELLVVLTDGMFAHDGSIAPLKKYSEILPKRALIVVDDAHAAGTLGKTGKGTIELEGVDRSRLIQTITLSKAFGAYGGAILGSRELREKIIRTRMFVGCTPMPLPMAGAAFESIRILRKDRSLRRRLNDNVQWVKTELQAAGIEVTASPSPIIAIPPKTPAEGQRLQASCLKHDVYPSFIRYPGGPANGFFRFVLSSEHSRQQLQDLVFAIKAV